MGLQLAGLNSIFVAHGRQILPGLEGHQNRFASLDTVNISLVGRADVINTLFLRAASSNILWPFV